MYGDTFIQVCDIFKKFSDSIIPIGHLFRLYGYLFICLFIIPSTDAIDAQFHGLIMEKIVCIIAQEFQIAFNYIAEF